MQDTRQEQQEENTKVYPSRKVVVPAMAAVYMAVFLVALVRCKTTLNLGHAY